MSMLARVLAVVGLELSVRAYPTGSPIRDEAQLALVDRLIGLLPHSVTLRREVPLPRPGDLRAWDLVVSIGSRLIAIEAETRPRDVQALQRRLSTKVRDDPRVAAVVLLLADTRHNRHLLREHGDALRTELPLGHDLVITSLTEGRDPGGSGIAML